jgi:phage terminase large subunit GpA-like protein
MFRAWPFQREPMDVLSPHDPTEFAVFVCASQMLKTTAFENAAGCAVTNDPGPILVIQPRESDVEEFSKKFIDPMIRDTACLSERFTRKKSRDAGNTINEKHFTGGSLTMLGAQTPENFQMRSIRYAFGDEVDRWPREVGKEGSTVRLFIMRTANFRLIRKVALASTPTLEGDSVIWDWWLRSDQRRFFVPCPFCEHFQVLVWSADYAAWPTKGGVVWGDGIEPADAHYRCESCERLIPNWRKPWMIDRGEWRKGNPKSKIAGFHLPRTYSLITPWGDLVEEFLAAKDDPGELKAFVNTKLAELWKLSGDAPDWEVIASRAEAYHKGNVPHGALMLTAGVDIQTDRIEVSVYGWGRNKQRWLVDHRILWGPTNTLDGVAWAALTAMMGETWRHESGADMSLARAAVDSGDQTAQVYDWARRQAPGRVIVIKGYDNGVALVGQPKTTETVTKRKRRGVLVYPINVSMAKAELYGQLRAVKPEASEEYPTGWFHHYREEDSFYRQLVAERFVQAKDRRGVLVGRWHKTGRNEALDCANYARAAAEHVGVSKMKDSDWRRIGAFAADAPAKEREIVGNPVPAPPPAPTPAPAPVIQQQRQNSGYLQRRRNWL